MHIVYECVHVRMYVCTALKIGEVGKFDFDSKYFVFALPPQSALQPAYGSQQSATYANTYTCIHT